MIASSATTSQGIEVTPSPFDPIFVENRQQGWIAIWQPQSRYATIVHHPATPENIGSSVLVSDREGSAELNHGLAPWVGSLQLRIARPRKIPTPPGQTAFTGDAPVHIDEFRSDDSTPDTKD